MSSWKEAIGTKKKRVKTKKHLSIYDTTATAQNGVYIYKEKNLNLENPYIYIFTIYTLTHTSKHVN